MVLENILPTLSLQGICFQGFRVELHVFEAWAELLLRLPASLQEGLLGRLRWPDSRKNDLGGSGSWWVLINKRIGSPVLARVPQGRGEMDQTDAQVPHEG